MTIYLYLNKSDTNVARKELSGELVISGSLKNSCSLSDPVLTINSDISIIGYNYMYIPDFKRWYFITDITVIVNDLFKVSAHVDVLSTYIDHILPLNAVIGRQENNYNLYLDDDKLLIESPRLITVKQLPTTLTRPSLTGRSIILTVASGESLPGSE